jgi:serine/threonine protein kinase
VIDGPDQGSFYLLPETGSVVIGNSPKYAAFTLHDMHVARVHCELTVEGDQVTVSHRQGLSGTLVNFRKIEEEQKLQVGDILRVGDSQLRLEVLDESALAAANKALEAGKPLSLDKLGEFAGHLFGHFALGTVLGRGHCGVVFRARDLKTNHEVALKVLSPEFPADDEEMQRFIAAMKTRYSLSHPNLVALQGGGKAGPYCWIAKELVEGDSATRLIERHRTLPKIPWRPAWQVAHDIGHCLELAHEHRIIHGNITSQNILLTTGAASAKLNDLLLQNALDGSVLQQNTMEAKMLAELAYLSPEQADPDSYRLDDLCDLYGLGVVVYALLTGRLPFEGNSPEEILQKIREDRPVRPKELQKSIPDELQAVVLKMLAKRPEERYPTPAAMLADLPKQ